jgi:hypothetical protein
MEPLWDTDGEEDSEIMMCQEEQLSEEDYEPEDETVTDQLRYTATPEDASSSSEQWRLSIPDGISYGSDESRLSDEDESVDEYGSSANGDAPFRDRRSTDQQLTNMPASRMGNPAPKRRDSGSFSNFNSGDESILGRETKTDATQGNRPIQRLGGGHCQGSNPRPSRQEVFTGLNLYGISKNAGQRLGLGWPPARKDSAGRSGQATSASRATTFRLSPPRYW